jgi:hypothetical protein
VSLPPLDAGEAVVARSFFDYQWKFSVSERDPSTVYVANVWSVYKSADGGCSWRESFSVLDAPASPLASWTDRVVAMQAPGERSGAPAYVLLERGGVPFLGVQTPRSDEWRVAPLTEEIGGAPLVGTPNRMWVAPSDPDVLYVELGGGPAGESESPERSRLYRSVDGGKHWRLQTVFLAKPSELTWWASDLSCPAGDGRCPLVDVRVLAIDPDDPDALWTGSHDGIFTSEDGGASWRNVNRATFGTLGRLRAIDLSRTGDALRVAVFAGWGLAWTGDGGRTWELREPPLGRGSGGRPPPASTAESVASAAAERLVAVLDHTASYGGTNVLMSRRSGWRSITPDSLACDGDPDTKEACLAGLSYVARARAYYAIAEGGAHLWAFRPRR